jgi:hypothetical protein
MRISQTSYYFFPSYLLIVIIIIIIICIVVVFLDMYIRPCRLLQCHTCILDHVVCYSVIHVY